MSYFPTLMGATGTIPSGYPGEIVSSVVSSGSAATLINNTVTTITTINLGWGNWNVAGIIKYTSNSATTTIFRQGITPTSGSFSGDFGHTTRPLVSTLTPVAFSEVCPTVNYILPTGGTIHLASNVSYTAGAISGYGMISATRL